MSGLVTCPTDLRPAVEQMLLDLDLMSLEVGLVPAPEQRHCGHCVRAVWCRNPRWYRQLCEMFPRYRRHRRDRYVDSKVKRADVRRVLLQLLREGARSQFAEPLLAFAAEMRAEAEAAAFDDVALASGCAEVRSAAMAVSGF